LISPGHVAHTAPVLRLVSVLVFLGLVVPACGKEIGDSCSTNLDCGNDAWRDCDVSQPGGYCTINGCDEKLCPDEAVCIRIFPYDWPGAACAQDTDCHSSELCLPDGFCVPRTSERRYCERKCGDNGDCRSGYVCREAGMEGRQPTENTYGSIALVANPEQSKVVRFCAPQPQ
jgi:hypothetical protein